MEDKIIKKMIGLTQHDYEIFKGFLIKADEIQLRAMIVEFQAETQKRRDIKKREENLKRHIDEVF